MLRLNTPLPLGTLNPDPSKLNYKSCREQNYSNCSCSRRQGPPKTPTFRTWTELDKTKMTSDQGGYWWILPVAYYIARFNLEGSGSGGIGSRRGIKVPSVKRSRVFRSSVLVSCICITQCTRYVTPVIIVVSAQMNCCRRLHRKHDMPASTWFATHSPALLVLIRLAGFQSKASGRPQKRIAGGIRYVVCDKYDLTVLRHQQCNSRTAKLGRRFQNVAPPGANILVGQPVLPQ